MVKRDILWLVKINHVSSCYEKKIMQTLQKLFSWMPMWKIKDDKVPSRVPFLWRKRVAGCPPGYIISWPLHTSEWLTS